MNLIVALVMAFTPVPVLASSTVVTASVIEEIKEIPIEKPITIDEKITFYAEKYKVSTSTMNTVIECESGFDPMITNWNDKHANSIGSHGIAQFSMETIKGYGKKIGIEDADPYNVDEALDVMAYMFSLGESGKRHWSCYNIHYGIHKQE